MANVGDEVRPPGHEFQAFFNPWNARSEVNFRFLFSFEAIRV